MLFNLKYFRELYIAMGMLLFVILIGIVGFMLLEDYTLLQAYFMTVITITTVGYGEVFGPLTDGGQIFSSILIISSFGIFAYAATLITRYLVSGKYREYFRDYRANRTIKKMKNHVIICGFGRNGQQAVRTLQAHKTPFLVIESNEELLHEMGVEKEIPYVFGDATLEENMMAAKIEDARALITTLPKDSDNLFVVLTARELKKDIQIISRASQQNSDKKLRTAGANNVIMPDKIGGAQMAELVVSPDIIEFLDYIAVQGPGQVNLEQIDFTNIPTDLQYKTFRDLQVRSRTGCTLIGCKMPDGEIVVNPTADFKLAPDSKLFVLGTPEQLRQLNTILLGENLPS